MGEFRLYIRNRTIGGRIFLWTFQERKKVLEYFACNFIAKILLFADKIEYFPLEIKMSSNRLFNLFPVENTIILQGVEWDLNKNELIRIIGNNLQQLRTEKGLTQEELAEKAGISTSFYANLERGNRGVSIVVLYDIAACLNVSVDYLLYPDHDTACLRNIELLLRNKPEPFIRSIEKMIRLCVGEFLEKD